jgi:type I restriction enzyme S subunit
MSKDLLKPPSFAQPTSGEADEIRREVSEWRTCTVVDSFVKNRVGRNNQIPAKEIARSGRFPVVDQGQNLVAGYCDDENKVINFDLPLIIFGDHTRCFKFIDFPFVLGADGTKVLQPNTNFYDPPFYYFSLQELELPSRGYNRHFKLLKEKILPLPPLSEQKKIAHMLATVQRAIEAQERIIQTTTELKKALMHKLFTEGLRNEPQKQTEIGPVPESWEVTTVGDFTTVKGGKRLSKGDKLVERDTGFPYIRVTDFNEFSVDVRGIQFLTEQAQRKISRYIINRDDVFISIAGSIGITGMIPPELDGANLTENAARLIANDSSQLHPRFLMYWLASHHCQAEIKAQTVKNAQPKLALARIKSLKVPLPTHDEQVEIARALDLAGFKAEYARAKHDQLQDLFRTLIHELMTAKTRVHELELPETTN